jgi:S-adenosylmethionine hydrolase
MAIVTFLSDFGLSDQYVAAVKAKILSVNPNITIVDITHQISTCDISHAAYTLQSVFREFPKGTVHIVAVSPSGIHTKKYIAIKLEDHFFVGEDSGLFGIISKQAPIAMVDINKLNPIESTFDAKDILAPIAAKLASGGNIYEMGVELENINGFTPTIAKIEKPQIAGNIVHIDHYGNLITNIFKNEFEHIHKINKACPFEISFRKEKFTKFHQKVGEVGEGECFAFFNSDNRLEIGINQGNGSQLLGLRMNNQVFINFKLEG